MHFADGDDGMNNSSCLKRGGSPAMSDMSRSLIVQNYFPSNPNPINACKHNSDGLFKMLSTCYAASGNRWSNYIAVDFYKVNDANWDHGYPILIRIKKIIFEINISTSFIHLLSLLHCREAQEVEHFVL